MLKTEGNEKTYFKQIKIDLPTNKILKRVIFGKYQIIKNIGKSAYSSVYLGKCLKEKNYVAIKIQDKNTNVSKLENEAYYQYLLRGKGIPKIISYGRSGRYNILIEQLLGKTIEYLFKLNKDQKSKMKDMCMTAIQIIDRIQYIHSKNIIHQDIKPENFLVGNPDNRLIYIIDFGFSQKYRSSRTGKHIAFSKNKKFYGTFNFSSINSMKGIKMTRRDDLESIGYMLIYLVNGDLPWSNYIYGELKERFEKIYQLKANITNEELCKGLPRQMCLYMDYVKSLKYEEKPNYSYLRNLFISIMDGIHEKFDLNFSWIQEKQIFKKDFSFLSPLNIFRGKSPFNKILHNIKEKSFNKNINSKNNIIEEGNKINKKIIFEKIQSIKDSAQKNSSNGIYGISNNNYNPLKFEDNKIDESKNGI